MVLQNLVESLEKQRVCISLTYPSTMDLTHDKYNTYMHRRRPELGQKLNNDEKKGSDSLISCRNDVQLGKIFFICNVFMYVMYVRMCTCTVFLL